MVCSTACGAFHAYADGISDMQASETVPLFLKGRQEIETDRMDIMPCLREQNPQQNKWTIYTRKAKESRRLIFWLFCFIYKLRNKADRLVII